MIPAGRHVLKKINERFFIDRDPRLFRYVLAFLRTRKLDLPDDQAERNMILREFDYFCLSPTNPCELPVAAFPFPSHAP